MKKLAVFTCATLLPLLPTSGVLAGTSMSPSNQLPANTNCKLLQKAIASNTVPQLISQESGETKPDASGEEKEVKEEGISGTVVSVVGDVVTVQLEDGSLRHLERDTIERQTLGNLSGTKVSATEVYCSRLTLYKAPVPEIPTSGTVQFIEVPPERPLLPQIQQAPPPAPAPAPEPVPQTW